MQCEAFEQKVNINQGCSGNSSVSSTIGAFHQCSWRVKGIKHNDSNDRNSSCTITTDWHERIDDYERWGESLSLWLQLSIETNKTNF